MAKKKAPLRVLMAFSEVAPFAKTGGLADVAGALPSALSEVGCDVRIVMPFYNRFIEKIAGVKLAVENLLVPLGSQVLAADVYYVRLDDGVVVYCVRRDEFFDRSYLYGTPKGDYFDNFQRFTYFSRAVLALCPEVEFKPNVVHAHDWQSGLVPAYLKHLYGHDEYWAETASIFTIHNIAYQGQFAPELFPLTGLPADFFSMDGMEFWGGINFMKAAIVCADVITTVSPRYSDEIQTKEYGQGLEGVLQTNRSKLYGILNGADYKEWSPETDPYIAANYSRHNLEGKRICKLDLLREVKLPERLMNRPLLGAISRLADQKGFDLLAAVLDKLVDEDIGLVILGIGDDKYQRMLTDAAKRYPDKVSVQLKFDERLAHKIEAGADMFLMPSRYEPCGLNQIYSLRYGTVPIVRGTGGLYDTIKPFREARGEGVGFRFDKYDPDSFWRALMEALTIFSQHEAWRQIMQNGMSMDFSWESSALEYLALYEKAWAGKQREAVREKTEHSEQSAAGSRKRAAGSRKKTEDRRRKTEDKSNKH
ncbi:MAG: glycogen synthase GlgA [Deltaproteobacteria bacterium]|nr:MAG: glycogen synthase GlgA [Deltaproteobacteria bacterium]